MSDYKKDDRSCRPGGHYRDYQSRYLLSSTHIRFPIHWKVCISFRGVHLRALFLAANKQLYKWFSPPVCLSVRPSVTPFSLCSQHRIIMKFSGVITNDKSDAYAKGQGQRSKVKVTEVKTPLDRFRSVTPVWIHQWHRRGALLFFKVIRQISRLWRDKTLPIWTQIGRFRTVGRSQLSNPSNLPCLNGS